MKYKYLIAIVILFSISSCIIQSPKYTSLEKVMSLSTGMTKQEVEDSLGVKPYDIKAFTDTSDVFIYIYRVTDRRTFSFNTTPVNGKESTGKYV